MAFPGAVPAGIGKRVLAAVIDAAAALLLGGAFVLAGSWQMLGAARDERPVTVPWLVPVGTAALLVVVLSQWWSHGRQGATLGRLLVGLRTVDADGGQPIGLARAALRSLVVAAGTLVVGVGQLVVLASPLFDRSGRHQGWHDKVARALVVDVVTGVDPAHARVSEREAVARLDGLLAPVAGADVGPARQIPGSPGSPRPPGPPAPAPTPGARPIPGAGSPSSSRERRPTTDAWTEVISAVPGAAPLAPPPGPGPLAPTVLVEHGPAGAAPQAGPHAGRHGGPGAARDAEEPLDDDVALTRLRRHSDAPPASGPPSAVLTLWDGKRLTLTGTALVGRNPVRHDDDPMPEHLVRVPDDRRSVSKTHVALGVDAHGVWVLDRGSTNGTVLTLPGGQQVLCAAGHLVRAPKGATVSFGDYWLTVG